MWTHLTVGTLLTRNTDGTPKETPKFWSPERARFSIPPVTQSHARPYIKLESDGNAFPLELLIFPELIGGMYQNQRRTLVAIGDAPSDPDYWTQAQLP